jgi:hypothetical protein
MPPKNPARNHDSRRSDHSEDETRGDGHDTEVEAILDERLVDGERQYKVRWAGFPEEDWMPIADLQIEGGKGSEILAPVLEEYLKNKKKKTGMSIPVSAAGKKPAPLTSGPGKSLMNKERENKERENKEREKTPPKASGPKGSGSIGKEIVAPAINRRFDAGTLAVPPPAPPKQNPGTKLAEAMYAVIQGWEDNETQLIPGNDLDLVIGLKLDLETWEFKYDVATRDGRTRRSLTKDEAVLNYPTAMLQFFLRMTGSGQQPQ